MKERSVSIGVDVGNYNTKTALTTTPTGYFTQITEPYGAKDVLYINGKYYVPDEQNRFNYTEDKTENEKCFVLTLIAVAKEIIEMGKAEQIATDHMQEYISSINIIHLGVGLPPAHMPRLKEKLKRYYEANFTSDGVYFIFNGYSFHLTLGIIDVFPQDFAAIKNYERNTDAPLFGDIEDYYAIDIGGYTVDIVPVMDGVAQGSKSDSDELGVLRMYDAIVADLRRSFGKTFDHKTIEAHLSGKSTMLSNEVKMRIEELCQDWTDSIINKARQSGILFDSYPAVFIGGGSQRLRKYIERNKVLSMIAFIPDASANAEGYEYLINFKVLQAGWGKE